MKQVIIIISVVLLTAISRSAIAANKTPQPKVVLCADVAGTLAFKSKCKSAETKITNLSQLKGEVGEIGATGPSFLLAAARVGLDGVLLSSVSGTGVTSITSTRVQTGTFDIVIAGSFSSLTPTDSTANRQKVIVTTSAVTFSSGISSAEVNEATSSSIKIRFFLQKSTTGATEDQNGFFFNALIAN